MSIIGFEDALRDVYRERPCEALPNALWKTINMILEDDMPTAYSRNTQDCRVNYVQAQNNEKLLVYWKMDGKTPDLYDEQIENFRLVLLHERYVDGFPVSNFPIVTRSFRMSHRGKAAGPSLSHGLNFQQVDPAQDIEAVAAFIDQCYEDISPTVETVSSWIDHLVYEPELWLWAVDDLNGERVGLGIAEVDDSVPEASLEWIQVHPDYRRRGLGQLWCRSCCDAWRGAWNSPRSAASWIT